jgi:hypothetical protein
MMHECGFCHKELEVVNHTNSDLFDVYLCENCMKPGFYTRFRKVCYKGYPEVLATTIRIDEFYVVLNYCFHLSSQRSNYTQIHKGITLVFDLDFILHLPLHDPALTKRKLEIYTTFS